MISIATKFIYNGKSCDDFGIILGRTSGLPSYQFGINRTPIIERVPRIDQSYFHGTTKEAYEFELELYKETRWTISDRTQVASWLFQPKFCDLKFINCNITAQNDLYQDIIYHCMPVDKIESVDFGGLYGIKIKMISSLPYAVVDGLEYFDLSNNTTTTIEDVKNRSNLEDYFYNADLIVKLKGDSTGFSIKNISDGGRIVSFTGLNVNEEITMKNGLGIIESSANLSRLSKWNKNYLRLVNGINRLEITGKCQITISGRYPFIM